MTVAALLRGNHSSGVASAWHAMTNAALSLRDRVTFHETLLAQQNRKKLHKQSIPQKLAYDFENTMPRVWVRIQYTGPGLYMFVV